MTETKSTDNAALTGAGQLYDAERRYVAITLTDELRDAIYTAVRETIAAGTDTTPGLYLRDIIAAKLNVTIDVVRAPNGTTKTDAEKRTTRIDTMAHTAGLLAQHAWDQLNAGAATNDPARLAAYTTARDAKIAELRAKDAKKNAAPAAAAPVVDRDAVGENEKQ